MSDDHITVTVNLSPRALELLATVNDVYIKEGGPVWECAQEWDEQFTVPEIEELSSALDAALTRTNLPGHRS